MNWTYCLLVAGRLIDANTMSDLNLNFPNFSSFSEAEAYLEANDIRATVIK